jgi:hypothetical protein
MRYALTMPEKREVDTYILAAPGAVRPMLEQVRALIKSAAPQGERPIRVEEVDARAGGGAST